MIDQVANNLPLLQQQVVSPKTSVFIHLRHDRHGFVRFWSDAHRNRKWRTTIRGPLRTEIDVRLLAQLDGTSELSLGRSRMSARRVKFLRAYGVLYGAF